jgi:hypothetical protein
MERSDSHHPRFHKLIELSGARSCDRDRLPTIARHRFRAHRWNVVDQVLHRSELSACLVRCSGARPRSVHISRATSPRTMSEAARPQSRLLSHTSATHCQRWLAQPSSRVNLACVERCSVRRTNVSSCGGRSSLRGNNHRLGRSGWGSWPSARETLSAALAGRRQSYQRHTCETTSPLL